MLGLTPYELEAIRAVMSRHPEVDRAVIFGSRAKGVYRDNSDVDIAVDGGIDPLFAESLAGELDEIASPYRYDVVAYRSITNDALREHIDRVGILVYEGFNTIPTGQ